MRERFIPTEEFIHHNSASFVLVDHLKGRKTLVHTKMNVDHVNLSSERGAPAQFVRRFRASYEQISRPHSVGSPAAANLALLEFCRTCHITSNQRLCCSGHQKTVYHTSKLVSPREKARPF